MQLHVRELISYCFRLQFNLLLAFVSVCLFILN